MSSKSDVKVWRAAGKTMLMCGRSYCAEQTLLLGSFNCWVKVNAVTLELTLTVIT